jgi:hypothetical protein
MSRGENALSVSVYDWVFDCATSPGGRGKKTEAARFSLFHARFDRCLRRVKLAEGQLSALQTDEFR